ncbi:MAG: PepSY domain-containing protein [Gemmatimonadales bacterium]
MMTQEEAIDRAKQVADEQGWGWAEPVMARLSRPWFGLGKGGKWEIFSNVQRRGGNVRVVIDAQTGDVLEKGYMPR